MPAVVGADNPGGGAGCGRAVVAAVAGFFDMFMQSPMFAWLFVYSLLNGVGTQIATTFTEYYCPCRAPRPSC